VADRAYRKGRDKILKFSKGAIHGMGKATTRLMSLAPKNRQFSPRGFTGLGGIPQAVADEMAWIAGLQTPRDVREPGKEHKDESPAGVIMSRSSA